jgi:hypothetical protein
MQLGSGAEFILKHLVQTVAPSARDDRPPGRQNGRSSLLVGFDSEQAPYDPKGTPVHALDLERPERQGLDRKHDPTQLRPPRARKLPRGSLKLKSRRTQGSLERDA